VVVENSTEAKRSTPVCYKADDKEKKNGFPTRTVTLNHEAGETVTLKSRGCAKPGNHII